MHRRSLAILSVSLIYLATSSVVWGGTFYIAANGSDSNNGTNKSTPWLYAPGMPNCSNNCKAYTPAAGDQFIFRGGDIWHFGDSSASPYTGGAWFLYNWSGTIATCLYEGTQTGCIYYGVDQAWFTGSSWTRPILTGDNPTSTSLVSRCAYQVAPNPAAGSLPTTNVLVVPGNQTIIDNFELTGMCSQNLNPVSGANDVYIAFFGTGISGKGMEFLTNDYLHGWTATTTAGTGNSVQPGTILSGGNNGLNVFDHLVIDGQDSNGGSWAWGTFPSFYHFRDSIVRYTNQGSGQWCHDIHDNIFEHMYNHNPGAGSHTNILECNNDSFGNAPDQPQNTPNVFYNNIIRHDDTSMVGSGQVHLWFCPNTIPEYWFNNVLYDLVNGQVWDYAGPSTYSTCPNSGGQFMFNNTFVDALQPCYVPNVSHGGQYLTVYNEHLVNTPFDSGTTACAGVNDASNIAMTDATATSKGYTTGTGGTDGGTNTCANESTTPCSPTSAASGTVGMGGSHTGYCTTLASYSSEYAIGVEAANACQRGTTDGCAYNSTTHAMICPGQMAVARQLSGAWDVGAYQSSTSLQPMTSLTVQ